MWVEQEVKVCFLQPNLDGVPGLFAGVLGDEFADVMELLRFLPGDCTPLAGDCIRRYRFNETFQIRAQSTPKILPFEKRCTSYSW